MRWLSHDERVKRGCAFCTDVKNDKIGTGSVQFCPYRECPYHEMDEFETYTQYLKETYKGQPGFPVSLFSVSRSSL